MGWVCKYCSTNNDDSAKKCFVCDNARSYSYTRTLTAIRVLELGLKGDVVIPEEYNVIGAGAFQNRTDITSVTIHSGVRKILKEAFSGCVNLRDINNKAELSSIGARAFYNCRLLPVGKRPTAKYIHEEAFMGSSSHDSPSISLFYSPKTGTHPATASISLEHSSDSSDAGSAHSSGSSDAGSARSLGSIDTSSACAAPVERREVEPVRATSDHASISGTTSIREESDRRKGHRFKRVVRWFCYIIGIIIGIIGCVAIGWAIGYGIVWLISTVL